MKINSSPSSAGSLSANLKSSPEHYGAITPAESTGSASPASNHSAGIASRPIPIKSHRGIGLEQNKFRKSDQMHAMSLPPRAPVIGSMPYPKNLANAVPELSLPPPSPDASAIGQGYLSGAFSMPHNTKIINKNNVLHSIRISRKSGATSLSNHDEPVGTRLSQSNASPVLRKLMEGVKSESMNEKGSTQQRVRFSSSLQINTILEDNSKLSSLEQQRSFHKSVIQEETFGDDDDDEDQDLNLDEEVEQFPMEEPTVNKEKTTSERSISMKPFSAQNVNTFL